MEDTKNEGFQDCPHCGYYLIRNSLIAECARCKYKTNWVSHQTRVLQTKGFKSYEDYLEFPFKFTDAPKT